MRRHNNLNTLEFKVIIPSISSKNLRKSEKKSVCYLFDELVDAVAVVGVGAEEEVVSNGFDDCLLSKG
jgi:hypothetical protein